MLRGVVEAQKKLHIFVNVREENLQQLLSQLKALKRPTVSKLTIAGWIRDYRSDEDAARANLDWEAILLETRRQIGRWNELGVGICSRFLDHATGA